MDAPWSSILKFVLTVQKEGAEEIARAGRAEVSEDEGIAEWQTP